MPDDREPLSTDYDNERFDSAIASMKDFGIPEHTARNNLRLLLNAKCAYRSLQIDEAINTLHLTESSPANERIVYLEWLSDAISKSDQRREIVVQALLVARENAKADTAPSDEVIKQDLPT